MRWSGMEVSARDSSAGGREVSGGWGGGAGASAAKEKTTSCFEYEERNVTPARLDLQSFVVKSTPYPLGYRVIRRPCGNRLAIKTPPRASTSPCNRDSCSQRVDNILIWIQASSLDISLVVIPSHSL